MPKAVLLPVIFVPVLISLCFCLKTLDVKCCECSCADEGSFFGCGDSGFDCRDPACLDSERIAEFPECAGDWLLIADGTCNAENNVFACGWDGGDVSPFRNADTGIYVAAARKT